MKKTLTGLLNVDLPAEPLLADFLPKPAEAGNAAQAKSKTHKK